MTTTHPTDAGSAPTPGTPPGPPAGCPVLSVDIGTSGPVMSHFEEWDAVRDEYASFWNDVGDGHWVVTRFEAILSLIHI